MKRILPLAACAALSFAHSAHAGLFDDTEARQQVENLRQDLQRQVETIHSGLLEQASRQEQTNADMARLRGQLEVVINKLETLDARQRDFYVDQDTRIRRLEGGGNLAASANEGNAPSHGYDAALRLLKDGKAAEALTALEAFISRNPESVDLPAANFWAGNAALMVKDVSTANRFFNNVLGRWPNDPIAADAMLGLANSYVAMSDTRNAQRTLTTLIERYPNSNAAQAAKQRLNRR
ncbi:tol-pal system protein YbgF [Betaproteobacteria bacterium]|nr:tol-pal system protein YbgF [Betaproteobacteria bacterium]